MIKCSLIFIISLIFFFISSRVKKSLKAEEIQTPKYKTTLGTIKKAIFTDTGNVWYYVSFLQDGNEITAKTDTYTSESKSLNPGDEVEIGDFCTKKRNQALAVILDKRVIPCSTSVPGFCKFLNIVGILLMIIALFMFIKINFI